MFKRLGLIFLVILLIVQHPIFCVGLEKGPLQPRAFFILAKRGQGMKKRILLRLLNEHIDHAEIWQQCSQDEKEIIFHQAQAAAFQEIKEWLENGEPGTKK